MRLSDYLSSNGISRAEFAKSIGVSSEAIRRYAECGRVPTPLVMVEILRATNGKVTANDFFKIAA